LLLLLLMLLLLLLLWLLLVLDGSGSCWRLWDRSRSLFDGSERN
jgi:hypothetical protein